MLDKIKKTNREFKEDYNKIKLASKYYFKNVLFTFLFMTFIVAIAITGVLIFLAATDETRVIHQIFVNDIPAAIVAALALSVFLTLLETVFNKMLVSGLIRDFSIATDKVINGDYSVRINIDNIKFSNVQLILLAENFNKMVEGLSKVDSMSNDFISNVSHEFKTPLSVIQSYAMLIQNPSVTTDEKRIYLNKIIESTQQLTSLVANILKLNKIENNQVSVNKSEYNLTSQLTQCVLDFEEVWESKGITIDFNIEDDITVNSDSSLLNLVWNNLISNAIKFTPNGGTISFDASDNENWTIVKISDTGCGMDEETTRHIFEKFYQGDTSHSEKGNGLGLALTKKILDLTGNSINVESKLGKGTTFSIAISK